MALIVCTLYSMIGYVGANAIFVDFTLTTSRFCSDVTGWDFEFGIVIFGPKSRGIGFGIDRYVNKNIIFFYLSVFTEAPNLMP